METVEFTFRNGRSKPMAKRAAALLQKCGHGTYLTRDMASRPNAVKPSMVADDGLDTMDKDQLHAIAKERGVVLHHMLGAEKARAALREAAAQ